MNNIFKGLCKSYYSFTNAIDFLLNYFKEKTNYNERYIDITKSLEYYFKNKKDLKLIQEEDIYYIMEEYNKYRKKKFIFGCKR